MAVAAFIGNEFSVAVEGSQCAAAGLAFGDIALTARRQFLATSEAVVRVPLAIWFDWDERVANLAAVEGRARRVLMVAEWSRE